MNTEGRTSNIDDAEVNTETSLIEEIRENLEKLLSLPVFKALYKTIEENVNNFYLKFKSDPKIMKYDLEKIKVVFLKNYAPIFSKEEVYKGIEKIPEIFSVVFKERQSALK